MTLSINLQRLGGRRSKAGPWLTVVAGVIATAHFASFARAQPLVTDIRFYVFFASQIRQGAVPHLDYFGNKTQLASFAGALFHRLGEIFSADPLTAIRAGYLGLAALTGVLLFVIHRQLAGGRNGPGFLALLAYSGFSLLGLLPAIGNVPKMLMALFASLAVLATPGRRWLLAGAAGWLSFMDWQIGGLALCAVFGSAFFDAEARLRALARTAAGTLLATMPFLLYFSAHDALGPAWQQTVLASLARGTSAAAKWQFAERARHMLEVVDAGCNGHEWLVILGVAGMLIYPLWIRRHTGRPTLRLAVALAIYHYGLVAFSLIDFQGYADLFILLHSIAFFTAVCLVEIYRRIAFVLARVSVWPAGVRRRRIAAVQLTFLLAVVLAVRPSLLRPPFSIAARGMQATAGVTLEDQREVSRRLEELLNGREALFLDSAELLVLSGRKGFLPFAHWHTATHTYYRSSPTESNRDTLARLLSGSLPDAMILGRHAWLGRRFGADFREVELASSNNAYSIRVFLKEESSQGQPQES